MDTSTAAASAAPTRRARLRAETTGQIKELARRQLAEHGPAGLSLRAIARQMGTASSALYRYFPSQGDLVTVLCVEAYDSLAAALAAARDTRSPGDHAGRWLAVCHAFRGWSLDHRADFALIFGTPLPGYHAPQQVTAQAAGRSVRVALEVYAAAVRAGAADTSQAQVPPGLQTGALWDALADDTAHAPEPGPVGDSAPPPGPVLAGIFLSAWASLLGYLVAEIFGSLAQLVADTGLLYQAHVRTVMLGMGYQPALVGQAAESVQAAR